MHLRKALRLQSQNFEFTFTKTHFLPEFTRCVTFPLVAVRIQLLITLAASMCCEKFVDTIPVS